MNSREKGKRGERGFAAVCREHGFDARRGQQFSGGAESPDVVSRDLAWLHMEVKHVEQLNLAAACAQAERDAAGKAWIVAHRRNGGPWRITMSVETFFGLVKGELPLPAEHAEDAEQKIFTEGNKGNEEEKSFTGGNGGVSRQDAKTQRGELYRGGMPHAKVAKDAKDAKVAKGKEFYRRERRERRWDGWDQCDHWDQWDGWPTD